MLRLRPFRNSDAKEILSWTSTREDFYKWCAGILGDFPVSEEHFLEMIGVLDDSKKMFPFTAFDEDGPVGFLNIRIPGEDDKKLRFGFVIVSPEKRGNGYGKEMLQLGLKYAFEVYGAEQVSLGVFENNPSAYHCYKSVGFEENGEFVDYEIGGEVWKDIELEVNCNL